MRVTQSPLPSLIGRGLPLALALALTACGSQTPAPAPLPPSGKTDTGWVSDTSFEVGAGLVGQLTVPASGAYAGLASDLALQQELVDTHLRFGKKGMEKKGYFLNQIAEEITISGVTEAEGLVTVSYTARADVLREKAASAPIPALEELGTLSFELKLPQNPVGIYARAKESCAEGWGSHTLKEYNYYYYFASDKADCEEPMVPATLTLREVYPERIAYPEYDRLLAPLDEEGNLGFAAAILPNRGDDNPMDRFNRHQTMLEQQLGLTGEVMDEGKFVRYLWTDGRVRMVIDLYDPTKGSFTTTFRKALGGYALVFYNGHSAYGTQPFLTEADAFSDAYQIVMMHSCRSYSYYTRQIFQAKATDEDPTGFALADVVATGESSSPYDSPRTLKPLLEGLMDGMVAVDRGEPRLAPSWLSIVGQMNDITWDIYYGAAGVRNNAWQPPVE